MKVIEGDEIEFEKSTTKPDYFRPKKEKVSLSELTQKLSKQQQVYLEELARELIAIYGAQDEKRLHELRNEYVRWDTKNNRKKMQNTTTQQRIDTNLYILAQRADNLVQAGKAEVNSTARVSYHPGDIINFYLRVSGYKRA